MNNRQTQLYIQNMFSDIKRRYPNSYENAFQLLIQCFSNILQHPKEISYRIINLIDQVIQQNLLIIPEILDILKKIGFSIQSTNKNLLIYKGQSLNILNDYISILNNLLQKSNHRTYENSQFQIHNNYPYDQKKIHQNIIPKQPQQRQNRPQNFPNLQKNNNKIENMNNNNNKKKKSYLFYI